MPKSDLEQGKRLDGAYPDEEANTIANDNIAITVAEDGGRAAVAISGEPDMIEVQ